MSEAQIKKLAKEFIEEQKRILVQHGDRVVSKKYKEALAGAQKTFQMISTASQGKSSLK
jgi:hypothetical protein